MKLFARMMRVVGVVMVLSAVVAGGAHASAVPFGNPVVADQQTSTAAGAQTGALISLDPIGSANPGVQKIVAPDGLALLPNGNYFVDPTGVVQREDQIYDVADESARSASCACNTGAIIEVNVATGLQTLLASGPPLVNPTALVIDPVTDDIYVLDRSAGTGGLGAIFRLHEDGLGGIAVTMIHDGGAGTIDTLNGKWRMRVPRAMDIVPSGLNAGHLIVADRDATPNGYTNGTIFDVDPNGADPGDGSLTPRAAIAWDADGAPTSNPATQANGADPTANHNLLYDPQGVIVRPDGYYVADSKDNVTGSNAGVIRVDRTTGVQTLIAGGYVVDSPNYNFFAGALFGIAPVDPTWTPTPPGNTKSDDLYVLDADFVDREVPAVSSGMVGVVDPTNTDPKTSQLVFGTFGTDPFSFNSTFNNGTVPGTGPSFVEPRALVTARNMPNPPIISVNTCTGSIPPKLATCNGANDTALGGAQIIEPADPTAPPGQGSCGAAGDPACRIAFKIRLNNEWKRTVKVDYTISDDTATAADYTTNSPTGTVTFVPPQPGVPGDTVKTVYAPVTADVLDEPDETIKITLSAPINGTLDTSIDPLTTLPRSTAIGTILDNDNPPGITATPATQDILEFNGNVSCLLKLDAVSGKDITVNWSSGDGTATAPGDYAAQISRSVVIPKGTLSATLTPISIGVIDDAIDEDSENFFFNLTGANNAALPAGTKCTANILDNDNPPQITIKDIKSNEGNSGQRQVTLSAALSGPSGKKISVAWATQDNAATLANKDYVQANGTVELLPGETSKSIVVKIIGDTVKEPDEPFKVVLSTPVNASILAGTASVTIVNDDVDAVADPGGGVKEQPGTPGGTPTAKACKSRRSFKIRVKKTKLRTAKVTSAKVFVNKKLVTTRKGKRLTAPVVLKGLKKGTYRVVIKAKLTDGRTVTDVRVYHTCVKKFVK